MALTSPASRCWQLNTHPRSDIHPNSPRALCTTLGSCCVKNMIWYLPKNICKWRRLAVGNGPSQAAVACPTAFGRRVGAATSRAKCEEMHGFVYRLKQSASMSISRLLNQSARHKLTAPSLTEPEVKPWRTLMARTAWKQEVIFRFRRWGWSGGCEAVKFPVKNLPPHTPKPALSENKLIFRLDGLYLWPLRK